MAKPLVVPNEPDSKMRLIKLADALISEGLFDLAEELVDISRMQTVFDCNRLIALIKSNL